ncbi:type II toxin-antitoxin system RelE/ParE family toxin [Candidatus Woesearchaeota archaeon]|jgi:mRNA-degrading endonuclease RelE of RelBE toxin-antitoxin system|nr:type II toxin-antitoxin system RelE/ParE family toxin [Candidatus Woesearchaeota archaeon]
MVKVSYEISFKKRIKKIKNNQIKDQIKKQILKIVNNPNIGKPMKFSRKGTRELYIKPFRLSYFYQNDEIIFTDLYHKNEQ